jgi:phosphate-selective porin OprO/OprP
MPATPTSPVPYRISSLDIPFIERSGIINAFGYGRLAGVGFLTGGANWSAAVAAQGDSLNDAENFNTGESTAISGRFTFAPIFSTTPEGTTLVHLGVHGRMRDSGDGGDYRYRVRPQNGRSDRWIESQNAVANSGDTDTTYGVEAAVQFGPFGAQAEYMMLEGENAAGVSFDADGYYVDVYWSLTGESRSYRGNQGSFGAVAPRNPVTEGGMGHWMLAARYDSIDLSDPQFGTTRGEQTAYAIGLDWVPIYHVLFKLN